MTTPGFTYRQEADTCCDECRKLEGWGPWCPRCGFPMPGAESMGERFSIDVCSSCWRDMRFVANHEPRAEHEGSLTR